MRFMKYFWNCLSIIIGRSTGKMALVKSYKLDIALTRQRILVQSSVPVQFSRIPRTVDQNEKIQK